VKIDYCILGLVLNKMNSFHTSRIEITSFLILYVYLAIARKCFSIQIFLQNFLLSLPCVLRASPVI
jgi:hypothetical protein